MPGELSLCCLCKACPPATLYIVCMLTAAHAKLPCHPVLYAAPCLHATLQGLQPPVDTSDDICNVQQGLGQMYGIPRKRGALCWGIWSDGN
ncbi:hypothetical protein COO60DRAFT_1519622 [Scenedesmus sp. NREL 46B-D3]|nr:hypothetical protein COO60DRAFT_1519622 [Scenedesmus sp. NREL 46B-D3]